MVSIVHNNILKNCGVDEEPIPGFSRNFYFIPSCDVASEGVPSLPTSPTSDEERVTISDNFTLKSEKTFYQAQAQINKGKIAITPVGGEGSMSYKYEFEFVFESTSEAKEAFGRMVKNNHYYVVAVQNNGQKRLLGTPEIPAKIEAVEGSLGESPEDENGIFTRYKVTAYGVTPYPPRYSGSIDLPSDIESSDT